jgi:hypothetical protein
VDQHRRQLDTNDTSYHHTAAATTMTANVFHHHRTFFTTIAMHFCTSASLFTTAPRYRNFFTTLFFALLPIFSLPTLLSQFIYKSSH